MKSFFKILSAALLLCAFAASCGGDSTEPEPAPTPNPPAPVQDDAIVIPEDTDLSPTLSQDGGSKTVRFTAKQPWQAYVDDTRAAADWIHVSPASGAAGAAELTITTAPNETPDDRAGYVKIVSGNSQVTFSVTQKQRDALTVSPAERTIDAPETEFEIEVRANIDFKVEVQADWIEQISTRALTTTVLKFKAKRNVGDERTGAIVIRSGEKSETITITQEKGDFIVDTEQFHIDAAAQRVSAKVRANIDFEVKPQAEWIHYNPTRAMTSYTLDFDIDENTTGKERTGEITVSSGGKSETIAIIQSDEAFDVEFDKTEVSHEGAVITATVNSNTEYVVVLPDDADWLTCVDTRAITTKTHHFKIEANPDLEPRSAVIKFVYQSEKGEATKQVTITQKSSDIRADCALYELDANGGQVDVNVQGNTASASDIKYQITQGAEWIHGTETRAVTAYFTFNIDKNDTGKPREGEIEFTLPDNTSTKVRIAQSETVADNTDIVHFPDANFKAYMVRRFDKNKDGEISEYEASLITVIYCDSQDIQSLEGIEHCTALTYLDCSRNQLTSLDVSKNTALTHLYCYYNQLNTLDVSGNTRLEWLECYSNQLTSLDVSNNTRLETLYCYGNQLTSLDVKNNTRLEMLNYSGNQLTSLDVSKNTALTGLGCSGNQLTSLDVSKNTALTYLDCSENQLTSLDVSNNTRLERLDCYVNQLTSLDVSNNTRLETLYCHGNQLTTIDISKNTALRYLGCSENQLTSLDISNNTRLYELNCRSNQLTNLDVSGCSALEGLDCHNNPLEVLNLGDNLSSLQFQGSSTKMKVIGTKITTLDVSENQLQSLDVSECPALIELLCSNNPLEMLNLGDADVNLKYNNNSLGLGSSTKMKVIGTKITKLDVSNNKLQSLNVSECPALVYLNCEYNQLTSLNVSGCSALTWLNCGWNQLTTLDVSGCSALTWLNCGWNQLTTLNVSGCSALTSLYCSENQLTSLDVSQTNLGNSTEHYPLHCVMYWDYNYTLKTMKTLYLKTGWKINGINVGRSTDYIPDETEILYKD